MLPGFRFLFAAIVLSMSVLVFGLGAAALLRAAHEQFASIPSRRAPPEPVFARQDEPPTLALLRVDPPLEEKAQDNVTETKASEAKAPETSASETKTPEASASETPASETKAVEIATASEPSKDATPAEPEKQAALAREDSALPETASPDITTAETTPAPPAEAAPAASGDDIKHAEIAETPLAVNDTVQTAPTTAPAAVAIETPSPEASIAATRIATLGGPAVTIEKPAAAKAAEAKPERNAVKKRVRAARKKERRRVARRARQVVVQQPADPFAQPTIVVRNR